MVATIEVAVGIASLATAVLAPGAKIPPELLATDLVAFGAVAELVAAPIPVYWPLLAAEEVAATGVEAAGAEADGAPAAGVVYEPVPEPELEAGESLPEPAAHVPPGALTGKFNGLSVVTWAPGLGKSMLKFSVVVHLLTLARLATNMDGNDPEPDPPDTETLAQFMYISRFPTLLNHVQANTASPFVTSAGTLKLRALTQLAALEPLHI